MEWLERIPQCVVEAHLEMLPRLQAEEALARTNVVAIGTVMSRGRTSWMRDQLNGWRRLASLGQRAVKATRESLAAVGIALKVVPRG
jgi:hypothetical protein